MLTLVCRLGELPVRVAVLGGGAVGCELVIQHEPEREQRSPHCRQRLAAAGASRPDAAGPAGWRRASASRLRPARIGHEDQGAYFEIKLS